MSGIIDSLKDCADSILGVRDGIGAALKPVFLFTRQWSGESPGDGIATDEETQVLPSPRVQDFSHSLSLREGGRVQQGDIFLRGISKNSYPDKNIVSCKSPTKRIEKFYRVGDDLYNVISVVEKHLTWSVQLRRLSSQTRGN